MKLWVASILASGGLLAAAHGCDEYTGTIPADADAGAVDAAEVAPDAPGAETGPACVHERVDLTQVVLGPGNTFVGDGSGAATLAIGDAGVTADVTSGEAHPLLGVVLSARGWRRQLGFAASHVKIRFATTTQEIQSRAVVGCWIIHVDSAAGISFSQAGFNYGGYAQTVDGRQALRALAPALEIGGELPFAERRPVGSEPLIVQIESTRAGERVGYASRLELPDGGTVTPTGDGGTAFDSIGLAAMPTEIVCGVSVYEEESRARASASWVEIDACP